MPALLTCPDVHDYDRLRLGQLPPDEADRLAEHLAGCDRCARAVQGLGGDDTLARLLRTHAAAGERPERAAVDALIGRLKGVVAAAARPPEETTCATDAATPAPPPPAGPPTEVGFDFLGPPQAAGELGRLREELKGLLD